MECAELLLSEGQSTLFSTVRDFFKNKRIPRDFQGIFIRTIGFKEKFARFLSSDLPLAAEDFKYFQQDDFKTFHVEQGEIIEAKRAI